MTIHYDDLGFTVEVEVHENGLSVIFTVTRECNEETELFLKGYVRSDHCSNWTFGEPNIMVHFCEKEEAMNVGSLLGRLYEEADNLMYSKGG